MAKPEFYIDGKLYPEPKEYRGMLVEINFENLDELQASITSDKFTFYGEAADYINTYIANGSTIGFPGVFVPPTFQVKLNGTVFFDGYIDTTSDLEIKCGEVKFKVKEKEKLDWMTQVADGFGYDLLDRINLVSASDYVKVPYILSEIPNYREAGMYFLSSFIIIRELERVVKDIADIIADIGGLFNAGGGAIKLIFYIAYLVLLIIALVKLIKEIVGELIQPVKYHYGMLAKTHFEKACTYLGLTFKSSLFDPDIPTNNELDSGLWKDMVILPKKTKEGFKRGQLTNQVGYWDGTFGDLIRAFEETYNCKMILFDGTLYLERKDYGSSTAVYQIPDVRREFHSLNTDELISNYFIQFQVDSLDLNTVNRYEGTTAKNYISPILTINDRPSLITGFKQPNIPFALGRRKNELTRVEDFFKDLFELVDVLLTPVFWLVDQVIAAIKEAVKLINKVIGAINTLPGMDIDKIKVPTMNYNKPDFSSIISNRIGMLQLSSEFIGVPKLIMTTGSGWNVKITTDNETVLSAENLWNKYHYIESFIPSANKPAGKQAYVYSIPKIPFCKSDYDLIRGSGSEGPAKILSPEGRPARIVSLKWNIWGNTASITYKEGYIR